MFKVPGSILDLFKEANLLEEDQLAAVLSECAKQDITPGQFLHLTKAVEPGVIRAAILSQMLIRDRLLPNAKAVFALRTMVNTGMNFEQSLVRVGWHQDYFEHVKLISTLLMTSGTISREQKNTALELCLENEIPLTNVLIQRSVISTTLADVTLMAQRLMAAGLISMKQASSLIKTAREGNLSVQDAIDACEIDVSQISKGIRMGELLMVAGIFKPLDMLSAVERSLVKKKRLGEFLVADGLISEAFLKEILLVQFHIRKSIITVEQGIQKLQSLSVVS